MRFTGRLGRRTLGPGAYRISARTRAGTAAWPIVVLIEPTRTEQSFACGGSSSGGSSVFAALLTDFASTEGGSTATVAPIPEDPSKGATGDRTEEKSEPGLLPAVKGRLRSIPEILPGVESPGSSSSPSMVVGAAVLFLLILSALGLLLYVIRFLRPPHAT